MSVKTTARVWEHSVQSSSNLLVLLSIADHCDDDGVCWPGIERLSYKSRLEKRQTKRVVSKLRQCGELFVLDQHGHSGGRGYTNLYFVVIGLSAYEIEDVLKRRFEYGQEEAEAIANDLIDIQNGGDFSEKRVSSKTPKKSVKKDTQKRVSSKVKRVSSKVKRVSSETKKGDIAMTPEPSGNHQEPSVEPSVGANAPKPGKNLTSAQEMFTALADLCKYDLSLITEKERGQLNQAEKKMRENGISPATLQAFSEWWYENDWRGQKNQPPTISDMRLVWRQFTDYQKGITNGGTNGQNQCGSGTGSKRSGIKGLRELGSDNPIKPIFDPDTGEDYYIDARTGQRFHPDACPCFECQRRAELP